MNQIRGSTLAYQSSLFYFTRSSKSDELQSLKNPGPVFPLRTGSAFISSVPFLGFPVMQWSKLEAGALICGAYPQGP